MDFNKLNRGDLNNLQNQDLDFDKGAMWANLEEEKRRRPVFWWWLPAGAVAFLLLVGGVYFYIENSDIQIEEAQKAVNQSMVIEEEITNSSEVNHQATLDTDEGSKKTIVEKIEPPTKSAIDFKSDRLDITSNQLELKSDNNYQVPSFSTTEKRDFPVYATNSLVKPKTNQSNKNENLKALDLLPSLDLKQAILNYENSETPIGVKTIALKTKRIKSPNLFVTPFVGIGVQFRALESKIDASNSDYLNARKANEKLHESWAAGFLVDRKIGKNLFIGTGLELLQHNEQLNISERETDNINAFSREEVPSEFLDRDGFLTKQTTFIYQNKYRLVNIPLSVSWMLNSKTIRFAPTASVVFNVSQKVSGHIENMPGEATDRSPFYKSNVGLGYRFGCRIYYPLNNRYLLFANPQFEINPSDVTQDINTISQKRNLLRLDVGLSTKI